MTQGSSFLPQTCLAIEQRFPLRIMQEPLVLKFPTGARPGDLAGGLDPDAQHWKIARIDERATSPIPITITVRPSILQVGCLALRDSCTGGPGVTPTPASEYRACPDPVAYRSALLNGVIKGTPEDI